MRKEQINDTVCWRLPIEMIDELGPHGIRELLERWRSSRRHLTPSLDEEALRGTCYRVPRPVVDALRREAKRLTEATGTEWSVARVVREIWRSAAAWK